MTTVRARVDDTLKLRSEYALRSMGLTMSTAINLFLQQVVIQKRIPFDIVSDEIPNAETLQAMQDTIEGNNLIGPFKTVEEMMEELDA